MNLNLGETIRTLRKKADMTQEQLADRLGVSYQSVSRWENGGTYPDVELLPAIANIFSVSMDALFDIPEMKKEKDAEKAFDALRREAIKGMRTGEYDAETVNKLIREIRRNYLDSTTMWRFWSEGNNHCYRQPDILPEVRLTAEAIVDTSKDMWAKNSAILTMATVEDEEHFEPFLARYASSLDISAHALKLERYRWRNEWDKYDKERMISLFDLMDNLCDNRNYFCDFSNYFSHVSDPALLLKTTTFQLETLNRFCGYQPDSLHPVSGNDGLDFWIEARLVLGFRHSSYLAALGKTEEAFVALEDCVSLFERIMGITGATILSCSAPWLKDFTFEAEPNWSNLGNNPDGKEQYNIWIHAKDGATYMIYPSVYHDLMQFGQFDAIRHDPRYDQFLARVDNLIQYR